MAFDVATIAYLMAIIEWYNKVAFTHDYIFGWIEGNNVLMVFLEWEQFKRALTFDKSAKSKGGMYKIRVKPNSKLKAIWRKQAIIIADIAELMKDTKHNKGENFERILTEKLCSKQWKKDNIPFMQAGDITYNGKAYQIKFENAELTNEKTFKNFNGA